MRGGDYKLMGYCGFEDVLPLIECRQKSLLPDNPQTVIVCLFPYFVGEHPRRNVARYAVVNDYHRVAGNILDKTAAQLKAAFPDEQFVCFVDNSPVREVHAARTAGLGVIGNHGMLIHEIFGSRVFIGCIVTTLALRAKPYAAKSCLNCGLCVKACPTKAFDVDKPLVRGLCRSFISQKKQALSDWEKSEIKDGGMAWGCDICTDVCPLNRDAALSPVNGFYENILPLLTRDNVIGHIAEKPYSWRGEAVILRNLSIIAD